LPFTREQLLDIFEHLRHLPKETEVFEFKEAKNSYDFSGIGKYFSALGNEANLKGQQFAWLIFGIKDKDREVVGSSFRNKRADLDHLKEEVANKTNGRITFIEIYELQLPEGRIVLFQIPAAPRGIPISFEGHYYGRDGEALGALNIEEVERIRSQGAIFDWSAEICPEATVDDLDPKAVLKARENFKGKFPDKSVETDIWDNFTFLNKAKLTIKGKITRTAILLLGRAESEHFLGDADAKIRWVLRDNNGNDKDYEIFGIPLLLAVDAVFAKIRNLKYRYMKEGTLFPEEVLKYEPFVIREALNNCIAHQDYAKKCRINVMEIEDEQLIFTNAGTFIPGSVEKVVMDDAPEEYYRNRFLATAMFNLKMVDTAGGGIKKMFNYQRQRFFPLPEYDLSGERVKVTITGKVLDLNFARILAKNPRLNLEHIIALDKVQKGKGIPNSDLNYLRKIGLIEGRKPNYFLSVEVIAAVDDGNLKAQYIKNRAFDDDHYRDMIIKYLETYGEATRDDLEYLVVEKLSNVLSIKQKKNKISNLLGSLRKQNKINNMGGTKKPKYILTATYKSEIK